MVARSIELVMRRPRPGAPLQRMVRVELPSDRESARALQLRNASESLMDAGLWPPDLDTPVRV